MYRIKPEEAPDVFRRNGLRPIAGDWVGDPIAGECCLLSALARDRGISLFEIEADCLGEGDDDEDGRAACGAKVAIVALSLDRMYAEGVMRGWDDPLRDTAFMGRLYGTAYRSGFEDGRAARGAVEAAGMAVVEVVEPIDWGDEEEGE